MKAIILAAGRGSRLGSLTEHKPKPLTILAGKSLLEWQMMALEGAGVSEISLVTGYCAEALANYGRTCHHNSRWQETNMVRSLLCASATLAEDTHIISYGDIVYRPDFVRRLMDLDANIAITFDTRWFELWSARFEDPLLDAESFRHSDGQLLSIGDKVLDVADIQGQYMGLLKFTPAGWRAVCSLVATLDEVVLDRLDMTSLLQRLLNSGQSIAVVPIDGGWVEVDEPQDITLYDSKTREVGWSHDWRDLI